MLSAQQALERLKAGNKRFVQGEYDCDLLAPARRNGLTGGQAPFAIILGCSDSRVPAEIVFNQGLGDLFVIRVAGNIVAPSQVGSIEFAAETFGTRLVVVLGHSSCGAVKATLDEIKQPSTGASRNLSSIVNRIRPAVHTLAETDLAETPDKLLHHAIRANIRASVSALSSGSPCIEHLIHHDKLRIVGAEYSLETGEVDFFEQLHFIPE